MICVIGGSGFVGTRLCNRLYASSTDFVIIDKVLSQSYPDRTTIADVRDFDTLFSAIPGNSVVINLAAEHRDDVRPRTLYHDVNVEGAKNICAVCDAKGVKQIIFTSSVAVYGFAPAGTGEDGHIDPFNDYGRTKAAAEIVFREWQSKDAGERALAIIRPTVIFGERNRGNVFNLLKQIATGRFVMVGDGKNKKSMAYVENVAAYIQFLLSESSGVSIVNYVDTPDFDMKTLVRIVSEKLTKRSRSWLRIPYSLGLTIGKIADVYSRVSGRLLPISAIRVKKFCATTQFSSSAFERGFQPPVSLKVGLEKTVSYEFLEKHDHLELFYTE